MLWGASSLLYDFILPALLAFGAAQFISYLLRPEAKIGWLLRRADVWLYIFAAFLVLKTLLGYSFVLKLHSPGVESNPAGLMMIIVLPAIAKLVVIVGLAVGVRQLLPIIEESKMLV